MSDLKNEKNATLKMQLKSKTGYSSKEEHQISPKQWGDIQLVIYGKLESIEKEESEPKNWAYLELWCVV